MDGERYFFETILHVDKRIIRCSASNGEKIPKSPVAFTVLMQEGEKRFSDSQTS